MTTRWAIASDHAGYPLKEELKNVLAALQIAYEDLGTHTTESCDYPDYAHKLARAVAAGEFERGILVCGTGLGVSIAANKHPGVRAALCGDVFSAKMSRQHNDANVLCLGARVVGPGLAAEIIAAYASARFEGGKHARRVDKIEKTEG